MSELKYKVGDKVRIKSLDWYNENKDEFGNFDINYDFTFYADRSKYCGKVFTISEVFDNSYLVKEDNNEYYWTDEMIEGLVEEETKPKYEDEVNGEYYSTPKYLVRPSGYQFVDENGNVINATKIVLEKKKKEYPKTFLGCCEVLDIDVYDLVLSIDYRSNKMKHNDWKRLEKLNALNQLLICRDAYWKLYGEEMGLGKPWENGRCEVVYGIYRDYDDIVKQDDCWGGAHIFEFPIREMRDAFKENFGPDIEICKELL